MSMMKAGMKNELTVFLFSDTQVKNESMLEDLNSMLNNGDVPNVYQTDEIERIFHAMRGRVQEAGLQINRSNLFSAYVNTVRDNLHLVITMREKKVAPKAGLHSKKVMLCIWWDWKGVLYYELLPNNETIDSAKYCSQLDKLKTSIEQKCPEIANRKDNARPRVSLRTRQKMLEFGWVVLPHPPYSPDLAPSDFHLLRSLQNSLNGKNVNSLVEIKTHLDKFFAEKPERFWKAGILKLHERWRKSVAMRFLTDIKDESIDENILRSIVRMCQFMHSSVIESSDLFLKELNRHNYVTPTSYLELLSSYGNLLNKKKNELIAGKNRLSGGLDKLASAEVEVKNMQELLAAMKPQLEKAAEATAQMIERITVDTVEAEETRQQAKDQEAIATRMKMENQAIRDEAEADLSEARPMLIAAEKSLKALNRNDITEVKAMKRPPVGVLLVIETICIINNVKPIKVCYAGLGIEHLRSNMDVHIHTYRNRLTLIMTLIFTSFNGCSLTMRRPILMKFSVCI
ncbi:dynein axonemal heavy chain 1-like [Megalopta genalis]|uniref:dynein axonemal heavy chain 1-like n=1 Tax=Megalopta genalis TaxID=115081 RepID=UPI003FD45B4B